MFTEALAEIEEILKELSLPLERRGKNLIIILDNVPWLRLATLEQAAIAANLVPFKPSPASRTFLVVLKAGPRYGIEENLVATFRERKVLIFNDIGKNLPQAKALLAAIKEVCTK